MKNTRVFNGKLILLLLWMLGIIFGGQVVQAATYYVAIGGNDSSSGTLVQPFLTIRKGLSVMKAGDRLYIRGGTYSERIDSNSQTIPTGTSWSDAPIIAAYPGEAVTLRPSAGWSGASIINLAHSYIQFVVFDGGPDHHNLILDAGLLLNGYGFTTTNGAHHVRLNHFEIKNAGASGVLTSYGNQAAPATTAHQFLNGDIHNNGFDPARPPEAHGFYLATSGNLIQGSKIHDNAGYNIQVYCGGFSNGQVVNDNVIEGNELYNSGRFSSIILSSGTNNVAINNIVRNSTHGIEVSFDASAAKVYNNTIYSNRGYGVYIGPFTPPTNTEVINNIIYLNGAGAIREDHGSGTVLKTNLTSNPGFVNAAALDFQIKPDSPATDGGTTLSLVKKDFAGVPRPIGSRHDIGAYECTSNDSTAPLPPANVRIS